MTPLGILEVPTIIPANFTHRVGLMARPIESGGAWIWCFSPDWVVSIYWAALAVLP